MGKRILLVDDDLYIRDVYEEVLLDEGYAVETAINGEEALVKLREGGYDLILLDIMMPKLDGLGVLEGLERNPPQKRNGPIILLTNLGHDPLTKAARSKGVNFYLVKADINPPELIEHVRKALEEIGQESSESPTV